MNVEESVFMGIIVFQWENGGRVDSFTFLLVYFHGKQQPCFIHKNIKKHNCFQLKKIQLCHHMNKL